MKVLIYYSNSICCKLISNTISDGNSELQGNLAKANERIEKITKILVIYIPVGYSKSFILTAIFNVIFCFIKYDTIETHNLYYPVLVMYVYLMC